MWSPNLSNRQKLRDGAVAHAGPGADLLKMCLVSAYFVVSMERMKTLLRRTHVSVL